MQKAGTISLRVLFDYGNAVLFEVNMLFIQKQQILQNSGTRLIA